MSKRALALLKKKLRSSLTPDEMQEQEIGFAYGNTHYENPAITRELVASVLPPISAQRANDRVSR